MVEIYVGCMVFLIICLIVGSYWHINIRGNYHVSKELSEIIDSFLNDSDTRLVEQGVYWKVLESGEYVLKIWSSNWPYAYGSRGSISKKSTGVATFEWDNVNPKYSTRKRVKNLTFIGIKV